jgi:cytochrome P450
MPPLDWTTEFDHFSPEYAADPFTVWDELRGSCPIARSEKFRGMWVPVRHADIEAIARDTTHFSSRSPVVAEFAAMSDFGIEVPPISSDPPYHTAFRHLLLPFFSPGRIDALAPRITALADRLLDEGLARFAETGTFDAARDYAQHIPVHVIAAMLGVPDEDADQFRTWVHEMLEEGPTDFETAKRSLLEFYFYLQGIIEQRRVDPQDDLVTFLANAELDGRPLDERELFGGCLLLLVAGIDTTWSAIGASVWHLAQHPDQQRRLRDEPELWATAIEEFLRAYAPVTMAREVVADIEIGGCPMRAGDPLLLPFPAANRDPDAFDRPDEVILDRQHNRHAAFGIGIHRCLGSNLARLELRIALERLLERVPTFALAHPDDPTSVSWSVGQVRGPRVLPLTW